MEQAAFNELKPEPSHRQLRPFCFNQVCDFEQPIPLDSYFRGPDVPGQRAGVHAGPGASKFALQTWQGYYSFRENRERKTAAVEATGPTKWQRLELTFTALANDPCGVVQFAVSGDGEWFVDDVLWEKL